MFIAISDFFSSDKTQVFHDKIQEKQKELQPWTAQINAKQANIDVASSERDALSKKADSLKLQLKESEETLTTLQSEYKSKVMLKFSIKAVYRIIHIRLITKLNCELRKANYRSEFRRPTRN